MRNKAKSSGGWTAKYDMGKCPHCEEPVIGIVEKNKYFSVSHYCKNPCIDINDRESKDIRKGSEESKRGEDSVE